VANRTTDSGIPPHSGEPDRLPLGFLHSRLPLGFQVAAAVGGMLLVLVACVAVAVLLVEGLKHKQANLNDRGVPYATAVAAAALNAKGIANDERGFFISGDPRFIVEANHRARAARAAFAAAAVIAQAAKQRQAISEAHAGFERWIATMQHEFDTFRRGERHVAVSSALGPDRALRKSYEISLAKAQALATTAIDSDKNSVAAASSRSITILLMCLLVGLLIGSAVAVWIIRTILRPVQFVLDLFAPAGKPSGAA
jgi:methyl-accepting chemotaxis protein